MKKTIYFLLSLFILAGLFSCKEQDGIYQEFVKKGGYVYPQKTDGLAIYAGYKRVKIEWNVPKDPSVRMAKVFWNNRNEVIEIDYSNYTDERIELFIEDLEERTYSFELVNFDSNGNQSMTTEIINMPYAENWLISHAERTIRTAELKGSDAEIVTGYGTDEMIATRFRYVNNDGETIIMTELLGPSNNIIILPNAMVGKRFEYSSSFCPENGLDTIWNDWIKSINPISGLLDRRNWGVEVTANQIWDANFHPSKVFDGIIDRNHRWTSAQDVSIAKDFPKIMTVDAGKDSYFINKVSLYQDQFTYNRRFGNTVEVYWGNEPFDPDAGGDYQNSPGFARAIANGTYQNTTFWFSTATWTKTWPEVQNFRYFAVVWKNSRSGSGWIDLWEMEFYGYDAAAEE